LNWFSDLRIVGFKTLGKVILGAIRFESIDGVKEGMLRREEGVLDFFRGLLSCVFQIKDRQAPVGHRVLK